MYVQCCVSDNTVKIINLFTFKMVGLFSKNQKIPVVGQTSDLLANMFDIGFSPAQGIKQY